MSAYFGWVDFSPTAKNKVKQFLDIMGMGGVMDELGIGSIRDNVSDKLYPGISTLYSRAKYFFITPYILTYWKYSNKIINPDGTVGKIEKDSLQFFETMEINANTAIIGYYKGNKIKETYFGSVSGPELKRQPSSIYWSGLKRYGLIKTEESLNQMLINDHSIVEDLIADQPEDEGTKEGGEIFGISKISVPYDKDWMRNLSENGVLLTQSEAQTLKNRMTCEEYNNSLISQLLLDNNLWNLYKEKTTTEGYPSNRFTRFTKSAINYPNINEDLRNNLILAYNLAIFLYGPHVVYNMLLRQKIGREDLCDVYRNHAKVWFAGLKTNMIDWNSFDIRNYFEARVNVPGYTKKFLVDLQELLKSNNDWNSIELKISELVDSQERKNKNKKSRFYKIEHGHSIESDIQEEKWIGLSLLEYRYGSCYQIVNDIYTSL